MSPPQVLLMHPGSLYGGSWAGAPVVKPELVGAYTVLARGGAEVSVLDLGVEIGNPAMGDQGAFLARAAELVAAAAADLVAISCWTALEFGAAVAVGDVVRRRLPQAVVAVFGYHPSVRPDDFTGEGTPFDWVIMGDPESSLLDIARDAATGEREAGTCRLGQGSAIELGADTAPDYASYPYLERGRDELQVYLSRGCQYTDGICYLGPGGGRWRAYPPAVAVKLIDDLVALGPRVVEVLDPTVGLDSAWRRQVLEALVRDDRRAATIAVTARPDAFTRADLDTVYRARLRLHLSLGTLSPSLLKAHEVPVPTRRVEQTLDLVRYANAKGVPAELHLTFGQPGETRATAGETLDALEELAVTVPNTSLWLDARPWAFFPSGPPEVDVEGPAGRYGTRIVHPQWWKEEVDSRAAAQAVVPSADLAALAPGDDSYWRPRFDEIAARLEARLTAEARCHRRSHESVGSAAIDVPHGFYREPRWH